MLAFYDLCAVLTPCGPLKALVNLMSKDNAPSMPGLLYEAQLPENATRPGGQRNNNVSFDSRTNTQQNTASSNSRDANGNDSESVLNDTQQNSKSSNNRIDRAVSGDASRGNHLEGNDVANTTLLEHSNRVAEITFSVPNQTGCSNFRNKEPERVAVSQQENDQPVQSERHATSSSFPLQETGSPTTTLPLAIAKIYKLPIVISGSVATLTSLDSSSETAYLNQELSAAELQTDVEARLPRNGGKIETTKSRRGELRYAIYNRDGELKRTLFVDENGKVMELMPREDGAFEKDNNIKLGLGDFIFYSVLVSKAAQNGFAPFCTCFLSIIAGLGGTLVLLAVYHHALPALPISIFIAVVMFVATIFCIEPWIHSLWQAGPYYI